MTLQANCQKCWQPLQMDDSVMSSMHRSQFDMINASFSGPHPHSNQPLAGPSRLPGGLRLPYQSATPPRSPWSHSSHASSPSPKLRLQPQPPSPTANPYAPSPSSHPHPASQPLHPADSFVVLTDSILGPARGAPSSSASPQAGQADDSAASALSPRLAQLHEVYGLLNSHSQAEHPLCVECMDLLLVAMQRQLEETRRERDRLVGFEKEVAKRREEGKGQTREEMERDINKLKKAERQAIEDLKAVEAEQLALEAEAAALDAEEAEVAAEEEAFWLAHGAYELEAAALRDRARAVETRLAHDSKELDKLQKTNVYNDAFCIGQEDGFGTINGLRLGRLPSHPVDWPEINAAWGHTLLLLHTIARKFAFTFDTYRLVPIGSFSKIEKVGGDRTVYELWGSGEFGVSRVLQNRRFDQAMVAFLECLRQLGEFVVGRDRGVKLPHAVVKDKIGDVSIKLQWGTEEAWTRALRHVLLTLKVLLGRASL